MSGTTVAEIIAFCAADNNVMFHMYDEAHQINESVTFCELYKEQTEYNWCAAAIEYWSPTEDGEIMISATLPYGGILQ